MDVAQGRCWPPWVVLVGEASTGVSWVDAGKVELDGAQYLGFSLPFSISQLVWIEAILVGELQPLNCATRRAASFQADTTLKFSLGIQEERRSTETAAWTLRPGSTLVALSTLWVCFI